MLLTLLIVLRVLKDGVKAIWRDVTSFIFGWLVSLGELNLSFTALGEKDKREYQTVEELVRWLVLAKPLKRSRIRTPMGKRMGVLISALAIPLKDVLVFLEVGVTHWTKLFGDRLLNWSLFGLLPAVAAIGWLVNLTTSQVSSSSPEETKIGVIYARVSTSQQAKEGESISDQIERGRQKADKDGISLPYDPVTDKGKTGTHFDRDGIQEVFRLAEQNKIDCVLIDEITRFGRNHILSLAYLYILEVEYNVEVISQEGTVGVTTVDDLINTTMKTLLSDIESRKKGSRAQRAKARKFLQKNSWNAWYPKVPFGYRMTDDGWIEIDDEMENAVRAMFGFFLAKRSYTSTRDLLNIRGELDNGLSREQVKNCLQKPVYKGKPEIPIETVPEFDHQGWLDEPELKIVDESTFDRVQEIIRGKTETNAGEEDAEDVHDFVERHDWFTVAESSGLVKLCCPECGSEMVKHGPEELRDSVKRYIYQCSNKECRRERIWPKEGEVNKMELLNMLCSNPDLRERLLGE